MHQLSFGGLGVVGVEHVPPAPRAAVSQHPAHRAFSITIINCLFITLTCNAENLKWCDKFELTNLLLPRKNGTIKSLHLPSTSLFTTYMPSGGVKVGVHTCPPTLVLWTEEPRPLWSRDPRTYPTPTMTPPDAMRKPIHAVGHARPYVGAFQVRSWSHWFVLGAILWVFIAKN